MAVRDDPWKNQREVTVPPPAPQSTGGDGGGLLSLLGGRGGDASQSRLGLFGGGGDSFQDMLGQLGSTLLMLDPQSQSAGAALAQLQAGRQDSREKRRAKNETAQWLQSEGVGAGEASFLTSNPDALKAWYSEWKTGDKPEWAIHELYNDKGEKQKYMIDMKTGNMNPIGGAEVKAPNVSIETIYDEKSGKERKVLFNKDTNQVVLELGGTKSDLLTPEEEEQKVRIAEASKASTSVSVGAGETEQSKVIEGKEGYGGFYNTAQTSARAARGQLSKIRLMKQFLDDPKFQSGAGTDFWKQGAQIAKSLGWNPEGLASTEAFGAMTKAGVLETLGSLGTGISEGDRVFIENSAPGLALSKQGNRALLEIQETIRQREIEIARIMREDFVDENGKFKGRDFDSFMDQWEQDNPVFTEEKMAEIEAIAKAPPDVSGAATGTEGGGTVAPGDPNEMVDLPGYPGVRVPRSALPVMTPEVAAPAVAAPETPAIEQQTQPRVRTVTPAPAQPSPLRFGR